MIRWTQVGLIVLVAALVSACASAPPAKDYSRFREAGPRSILVVPVVNNTNEVEAASLMLSTLPVPLAERGYYVFPVNMVKLMMEEDGLADAALVHAADATRVAELFAADAVLFVEIDDWEANYQVISSNVSVKLKYTLKEAGRGDVVWETVANAVVDRSSGSGNIFVDLIAAAVVAAIDNARADYTDVAIMANRMAFMPDGTGLPYGPYNPGHLADFAAFPSFGPGGTTSTPAASDSD